MTAPYPDLGPLCHPVLRPSQVHQADPSSLSPPHPVAADHLWAQAELPRLLQIDFPGHRPGEDHVSPPIPHHRLSWSPAFHCSHLQRL